VEEDHMTVSITIAYPKPNPPVPGNGSFTATGGTDPASGPTVTASVIKPDGTRVTGSSVTPTAPNTWAFQFTNVPINVLVKLDVHAEYEGRKVDEYVTFECRSP
jgi:hypothetical protein